MKNLKFYLLIFTISSSVLLLSFVLLPKEEIGGSHLFEDFISQFEKAELPYSIIVETIELEENNAIQTETNISDKRISHNFSAFIPGLARSMFSRMPPSRFYFKDIIYENENFVLVTYGIQSYRGGILNAPDEYVLASYSKKPKTKDVDRLLSLRTVAKKDYSETKGSVIGEDLMIKTEVTKYERNAEGELVKSSEKEKYKIAEDGKIKVVMTRKVPQTKEAIIRAN